jgi:hypothetical protein
MNRPFKVELENGSEPISRHATAQEAFDAALAYNEKQPGSAPYALVYQWDPVIQEWQTI